MWKLYVNLSNWLKLVHPLETEKMCLNLTVGLLSLQRLRLLAFIYLNHLSQNEKMEKIHV